MASLSSKSSLFDISILSNQMGLLERSILNEMILSENNELNKILASGSSDETINEIIVNVVLQKSIDLCFRDWTTIFLGMTAQDAKRLAKDGREQLHLESRSLTYGEVDFFSFATIVELVKPKPGSVFVDLGHGTGRAIVAAAMLRGGDTFKELIGIEMLVPLVDASKLALTRYQELVQKKSNLYCESSISLYQGDFLSISDENENKDNKNDTDSQNQIKHEIILGSCWLKGDFIFANSTCFSQELMMGISRRAEELKPGTVVVTLTSSLASPYLKLTGSRMFAMSWGASTAFFHVRI